MLPLLLGVRLTLQPLDGPQLLVFLPVILLVLQETKETRLVSSRLQFFLLKKCGAGKKNTEKGFSTPASSSSFSSSSSHSSSSSFFSLAKQTGNKMGESVRKVSRAHSLFWGTYSTFFFPPPPAKLSTAIAKKTLSRMSDHRSSGVQYI